MSPQPTHRSFIASFCAPYIRKKMESSNSDFFHLEGMHTIDIVYDTPAGYTEKETALAIYSALTDVFKEKPHSLSNYIDHPKENGYQSLHVYLLADNGHWQEVHIGSQRMKRVRTLGYIAEQNDVNISSWLEKLKSTLRDVKSSAHTVEFMDGVVASFYNDDIIVYTPQSRAVTLPKKATALDFAFEIHTDIGLHAKYAIINGKLQPISTQLHRGDIVEIGTDPDVYPTPNLADHVITYKAKRHINAWLLKQKTPELIRCTHCNPIPGDEVIGFKRRDGMIEVHKRDCSEAISMASQNGDAVVAVEFKPSSMMYPVGIHIRAVDSYRLLTEIISCINFQQLPILGIDSTNTDYIVDCKIKFLVHSSEELQRVVNAISDINGVDEVLTSQ